jgi:hypothetical protein
MFESTKTNLQKLGQGKSFLHDVDKILVIHMIHVVSFQMPNNVAHLRI